MRGFFVAYDLSLAFAYFTVSKAALTPSIPFPKDPSESDTETGAVLASTGSSRIFGSGIRTACY